MNGIRIHRHNRRITLPVAPAVVLIVTLLTPAPGLAGGARAMSGDMLVLAGIQYCLFGIDAPEPGQRCTLQSGKSYDCGRIATTALMDLLAGAEVRCRPSGARRTECVVARCTADGFDLSGNMVHTGWALADPADGSTFLRKQHKARANRHGLWRGRFQTPWAWRRDPERPK